MQMGRCCMCDPPPVLPGDIRRFVYPSFPADYEGISTAAWSSGTTGDTTDDFNCRYVTLSTPNRRETSSEIITEPVRFAVYGPASDGGTFDNWVQWSSGSPLRRYLYAGYESGFGVVTDGMIPSGSHAEWADGQLALDITTSRIPFPILPQSNQVNLYSVSQIPSTVQIYAFAHRVNGSIVGSVKVIPFTSADYLCDIADGDTYEVDVWYKVLFTASTSLPATPGSVNRFLQTTKVANGSRRLTKHPYANYFLSIKNANFSPAFNVLTQTYEVSISGHTGWTLLAGTNGPIEVTSYAGYWTGGVGNGTASLVRVGIVIPIQAIYLQWNREIAHVVVTVPAGASTRSYIYRSTTASPEYRSRTVSTDMGEVDHTWYGFFNQAGTTTFEYVPWNSGVLHDGWYTNTALPAKPPELPQTITFTRIPRPTTGSVTYDSGSGTFTVPSGKTVLLIEGWGAGGGGGGGGAAGGSNGGSGGGGGGYFSRTLGVSPGDLIPYVVGTGGAGGTNSGTGSGDAGGDTTVFGGTYTAGGGGGGDYGDNDPTVSSTGGNASGGDTNTTGGVGAAVTVGDNGSAGGAGANGGAGGVGGVDSVSDAGDGVSPGGGGGGGAEPDEDGGAGANGRVRFTW